MDSKERYGPWAVVAGASEGIGRSFARKIAAEGIPSILIALEGPLEEVAAEIYAESGIECIVARIDLAAADAFDRILEVTGNREIGLYVANAGGDYSASHYLDWDIAYWLRLANLNITTTMQACHHFGGLMRERGRGGLLMVNSGGCYGGSSYLAMYTACKGFLLNFAEGLWCELHPRGVDVLTIALGMTDTPKFRKQMTDKGLPLPVDLASPDEIAEIVWGRLPHGPVYNWALADDEAGDGWLSAAARRDRVLKIAENIKPLYGS